MINEVAILKKKIINDLRALPAKSFMFIFVVGVLLRIIAFDMHETLHMDEAIYANWSATIGHSGKLLFTVAEADKPPLLYYMLGTSIFLFGPNDCAIKIPGLIIGILMIILVALIAKNLNHGNGALWASLFYALSPFEISYAPTAFAELTCVFFCLMVILFLQYRLPFLAGLFIGLALATKQTVFYFLPLYIIFYLIKFHDSHKLFLDDLKILGLGFLIVFVPLLVWALFFSSKGLGIFFAVFRSDYVVKSQTGFHFLKWLYYEKFVTGNYLTLYFSLLIIFLARLLYLKDFMRKMDKKSFMTVLEIISLILFILAYYLMISVTGYPVYSRYLLVITSLYLIVFGVSFASVLNRISEFIKYERINRFIPVIGFCIAAIWILKAPGELYKFPDASNYSYHESIEPCIKYIKQASRKSAVYYSDETWPWVPWYVFSEKRKGRIRRSAVDFKTKDGIKKMMEKMTSDFKKLKKKEIFFILNSQTEQNVFSYIEQLSGVTPDYKKVFVSQGTVKSYPSYSVYSVKLRSILPGKISR